MAGNPPLLNGSFPARDPFENAEPMLKGFESSEIDQVSCGNSMLRNENRGPVFSQLGENFGGLAFQRGDDVGLHRSDTKVSFPPWQTMRFCR